MRHHSLLHLIGAVVYEKYGALCTGNQIYPDKARIDFNELQELSSVEVEEIVKEVNKLIEQNKRNFYSLYEPRRSRKCCRND